MQRAPRGVMGQLWSSYPYHEMMNVLFLDILTWKAKFLTKSKSQISWKDASKVLKYQLHAPPLLYWGVSVVPATACTFEYVTDSTNWKHLQRRFERVSNPDKFSDVYDGREYQHHRVFLSKPENISLLLNTDGVSIFRSSTVSLWPILLVINELPPSVRFVPSQPREDIIDCHCHSHCLHTGLVKTTCCWLPCGSTGKNPRWPPTCRP